MSRPVRIGAAAASLADAAEFQTRARPWRAGGGGGRGRARPARRARGRRRRRVPARRAPQARAAARRLQEAHRRRARDGVRRRCMRAAWRRSPSAPPRSPRSCGSTSCTPPCWPCAAPCCGCATLAGPRPGGRQLRARCLPCPVECCIGGDATSLSIAAASIVAKVVRDRAMTRLAQRYPHYGWHENAGYGTPIAPGRPARSTGPAATTGPPSAPSACSGKPPRIDAASGASARCGPSARRSTVERHSRIAAGPGAAGRLHPPDGHAAAGLGALHLRRPALQPAAPRRAAAAR